MEDIFDIEKYEDTDMRNTVMINVVFKRGFGPWTYKYKAKKIVIDFFVGEIKEFDQYDSIVKGCRLIDWKDA